jgi:small basic protein (TIGR04137 family)
LTEVEPRRQGAIGISAGDFGVPIDKSLRRRGRLVRSRNVLTREERIDQMKRAETWIAGRSPLGLPKTRVVKVATKKKKKAKEEGTEEGAVAPAAGAPAPAAGAAAAATAKPAAKAAAKPAAAKPAAKPGGKG